MQEKEWHEFRQHERNTTKTAGRPGHSPVAIIALIILLPFIIAPAAATDPTVIVTGYEVTPAVLLPGDMGTITLTIKNTAETASVQENSGIVTSGVFASMKSTDINVFVENVHMEENGIE
ncbi:MAG: hypothetical protein PHF57_14300, partial [Methanoregula sp.]|nr:hypothetical protein [Methanoregula sp.]